jgi:hypothetical protein
MFNDLISALLSASNSTNAAPPDPMSLPITTSHSTNDILSAFFLSPADNEPVDQSLVDSWMNILQTFPQPTEGYGTSTKPSFDGATLESFFGIDTPSDWSAFTSPASGDLSTFCASPNPDAQQQTRTLDHSSVDNLDMALNLVAGQSQTSTDLAFDLPRLSGTNATQDATQALPISIPSPSSMDIDDLIDPQLLNISLPTSTEANQILHITTTREIQTAACLKIADTQTTSAFLPSPVSTLEPATPSSAGWDTSLAGVVAGDQSQPQGM